MTDGAVGGNLGSFGSPRSLPPSSRSKQGISRPVEIYVNQIPCQATCGPGPPQTWMRDC